MSKRATVAAIALLVVFSSTVIGASAFTSATLERDASVDVVTDGNGIIGLADGNSGGIVTENNTGALSINFSVGSATGINPAATYTLGDTGSPTSFYAFNITNNDAVSHTLDISYSLAGTAVDTDPNIKFHVYNSGGTTEGTVTEEDTSPTSIAGINSGSTLFVVIEVDTHGLSGTNSDDLSGTLTITVS